MSIVMPSALGLNGDWPLMPELESTTYTCYIVDLGGSPHEAPIPCAFKMCSTFQTSPKPWMPKMHLMIGIPFTLMLSPRNNHHLFPSCKILMLLWVFGLFKITNSSWTSYCPPYMNVAISWWNARMKYWVMGGWELNDWCCFANPRLIIQARQFKSMIWPRIRCLMASHRPKTWVMWVWNPIASSYSST
jgi:hypothetical protein